MKKTLCSCGGIFEDKQVEFEGFDVKALKCNRCGELTFTPEQFKDVLALRELANKISSRRRIVRIGNSLGITLPKSVKELGLGIGSEVKIKLANRKSLQIVSL